VELDVLLQRIVNPVIDLIFVYVNVNDWKA
jgi:hypothetical protein